MEPYGGLGGRRPGPAYVLGESEQIGGGLECPLCFGFGAIAPGDFGALEAILCPLCDAAGTVEASVLMPEE